MTKIFTKLRALVDEALSDSDTTVKKVSPVQQVPLEQDLFDHRLLSIEEDVVNRMLRAALRNHKFFYSITFEFEPNNQIFLSIITKWGNVITAEFTLEDLHLLGNWFLSLFGIFFNPIALGEKGSTVRFEKKGIIRFDLIPNTQLKKFIPLPERSIGSVGPVLLANPQTSQSVLQIDYYAFHDPVDTFTVPDVPIRTSWLRSIDIAAVLLMPIGVWLTFIFAHHYLPTETLEFSFSTYFLISLGIFILSLLLMNTPRYLYMYFDSRKQWQSAFVHNNIKIQMRKLHRRIFMQQATLTSDCDECTANESQERIKHLLLQIRDKRFLANRLKIADDDRMRKQKVKFIIAYIGCTLIELMLLMNY